ncbi:helix-turn-helix transcriptional regulator [Sulfurimonas sp.]|uniref:helix-turn-helix transcriptional regulator n=1 Tax=Sulfurimonas sp. TaxID=2022749 RepID=UPI00356A0642
MAKHEYDKILTRLINILSILNDGEQPTTKELAERFNVADRTILRDMERLSSFPIYKDSKRWKMQDGFKLEKNNSFEEEVVLGILEEFSSSIGGKFSIKAHQLLDKLKNDELNPIYTKLNIEDIGDKFDEIKILEDAIKNKNILECIYDDEFNEPYKEILKPLKIVNYEGFWYLVALDEDDYVRKLYLKKVSNIKVKDEVFKTSTKIDEMLNDSISIWFQSDREPFDIHLYVGSDIAKYFRRKPLPTQKLHSVNQDGSLEIIVTITYEMEIIPIVKYWMPHLRVIEPKWLDDKIAEDVREFLNEK